jgi:hypothetical protein
MEGYMINSLNLNWAWKNFTDQKVHVKSQHLCVAFAAGCIFQFVTFSAISCYISSEEFLYAGAIGIVVPITALCIAKVMKPTEVHSPRKHKEKDEIKHDKTH